MILYSRIEKLPAEILEKIFSYLNYTDIASVTLVSNRWRKISQRLVRCLCLENISDDILTEILANQECGTADWACVWYDWLASSPLISNTEFVQTKVMQQRNVSHCVAVNGDSLYIGDGGWIVNRSLSGNHNLNQRWSIMDGPVHSLSHSPYFDLLIAVGQTSLHFFDTTVSERLTPLRTDFSLRLGNNHHISVFGPRFCVSDWLGSLQILEIYYVGMAVRTQKIGDIALTTECQQWELWKEKVICCMSSGQVVVYNLLVSTTVPVYRSEPYTVIMYKNPTWIYRDVVFSSTLASRGLENSGPHTYVYMSDMWSTRDGTGHWFIGPIDNISDASLEQDRKGANLNQTITATTPPDTFALLMRGFCLKKQYPGSNCNCDVTCLSMRRRLLLCGTDSGQLLLYPATETRGTHSHTDLETSSVPSWKQKVCDEPIQSVHIGFSGGNIHLYFLTSLQISCVTLDSVLKKIAEPNSKNINLFLC